jgi:deoxyxylulose-5-phosphate synthase
LLRRGPRRHGAFGGAGHVRGARPARLGRECGLHFWRRGADQRHFLRGLNNIAHTTRRFIGILNDNEWSIAKNVGAISNYLNKLITNPRYNQLQKDVERLVKRMPKGDLAIKLGHKAEEALKSALPKWPGTEPEQVEADGRGGHGSSLIFEEMGLRYLGPIDGHDLPLLDQFAGIRQGQRHAGGAARADQERARATRRR